MMAIVLVGVLRHLLNKDVFFISHWTWAPSFQMSVSDSELNDEWDVLFIITRDRSSKPSYIELYRTMTASAKHTRLSGRHRLHYKKHVIGTDPVIDRGLETYLFD